MNTCKPWIGLQSRASKMFWFLNEGFKHGVEFFYWSVYIGRDSPTNVLSMNQSFKFGLQKELGFQHSFRNSKTGYGFKFRSKTCVRVSNKYSREGLGVLNKRCGFEISQVLIIISSFSFFFSLGEKVHQNPSNFINGVTGDDTTLSCKSSSGSHVTGMLFYYYYFFYGQGPVFD